MNDFTPVKFESKRKVIHYDIVTIKYNFSEFEVKYMKKKNKRFIFPQNATIEEIFN